MWNVKILCLNLKISWLFYLCMQVFHVTIFFSECRLFQQISTSWVMLLLSGFRNMPFNYISAVDACLWSIMPSYVALVFYSSNWINYVCPKSLYGWTMWCELNIDIYGYTCDEMVWFFFCRWATYKSTRCEGRGGRTQSAMWAATACRDRDGPTAFRAGMSCRGTWKFEA
jgi:hypothetical protein